MPQEAWPSRWDWRPVVCDPQYVYPTPARDLTEASYGRRTFKVSVTAPLILAQMIGPRMSAGGSIVNIASTDAFIGSFRSIAYSASKAALLSVTRSLANVLGPRELRVNG